MAEMHFGNSAALTDVIYNGTSLDKVYYNNVLVFEKLKSNSETISVRYYASGGQSTIYFSFPSSQEITLKQTPKKVTSISGGLGHSKWTITNNLSGTVQMPYDSSTASGSGSSYVSLNWSISGNIFKLSTTNSSTSANSSSVEVYIEYEY